MLKSNHKVIHLTSAHPRNDTRIFIKMCTSLANDNYKVLLVVADDKNDELKNKVSIIDVGATKGGRFSRMTKTVSRVFEKAKKLFESHDKHFTGLISKSYFKTALLDLHIGLKG